MVKRGFTYHLHCCPASVRILAVHITRYSLSGSRHTALFDYGGNGGTGKKSVVAGVQKPAHFRTFTTDEAVRAKGIVGYAGSALSSAFD